MDYINLDKWRALNETLFKAYIDCYKSLSTNRETLPEKAMVKSLAKFGILMKVDEDDYKSFYTIARELGIYYQDKNDRYFLGTIAQKFVDEQISYEDYLKNYILNTEFLINGDVVHPFEEIFNTLQFGPQVIEAIVEKCKMCIPIDKRSTNVTDKLNTFLKRAVESGLLKKQGIEYALAKAPSLIKKSITKSGLNKNDFEEKFVGIGKLKQENIVKYMIKKSIWV